MPNPGGPYGGCNEYRRRKVKCDQTYPACRRCLERNTICPGTTATSTQIFRDETYKTAVRALSKNSRVNGAAAASQDHISADGLCGSHVISTVADAVDGLPLNAPIQSERPPASLPKPLNDAPADVLTAFFFDQLTCPTTGWYSYLPRLQQRAPIDGYLNTSIQAASLFVLANQRPDRPELIARARTEYSDALSALNAALSDCDARLKDEVPCAVLILIMIEDITGSQDQSCRAHLSGLQQVLRIRKDLGIKSPFGAEIWHSVAMKTQSLSMSTLHETSLLEQMLLPASLVTPALQMHEVLVAGRELDEFIARVSSDDIRISHDALYSRLQDAKLLDLRLEALGYSNRCERTENRWQRGVVILPDSRASSMAEYFSSLEAAQYWNQNRCARIHLHQNILKLAAYILQQGHLELAIQQRCEIENMITESRQLITELLDAICHSIPFNLHQIDSYGRACERDGSQRVLGAAGLVWPLGVVLRCEHASDWQRDLARNTLRYIGYEIGVRQALIVLGESE